VDGVGLRHPHVGARALEAGEAARAIAHAAECARVEALAQCGGHRMEAEDVPDLEDAAGVRDDAAELPALVHRQGQRLLDEAIAARAQALAGQGQMVVGGRHDVHRVHVGQRSAEILDRARGSHPRLDRERPALGRDVGHPQLDSQLAEHAQVLLAPAAQPDQQDPHRAAPVSPPTSSAIS
jgi:hypothetical protein